VRPPAVLALLAGLALAGPATGAPAGAAAPRAQDARGTEALPAARRSEPARRGERRRLVIRKRRGRAHVPPWPAPAAPVPGAVAAPAPAGPQAPAPAPPPGGGGPAPPPAPTCGTAVGARETEWAVTLSRSRLCAGQVTVEAQNWGQDAHDLWLQPEGGAPLWKFGEAYPHLAPGSPGGVESRKLTLAPGRYTLFCSLTGGTPPGTPGDSHAAAGMTATFTVITP
jgi:hypothetical protein